MDGGKTDRLEGEAGGQRGGELLRGGGTVAFPTETVYGLGANALDAEAVAKIFAAKERPEWDPLIVHVSDRVMLARVAEIPVSLARDVEELIKTFWPGARKLLMPLTTAGPGGVPGEVALVAVR